MNVSNLRLLAACLESREPVSDELADAVLPDLWALIHKPEDSVKPTGRQLAETRCAFVAYFHEYHDMSITEAIVEVAECYNLELTTVTDNWNRHGKITRARMKKRRRN